MSNVFGQQNSRVDCEDLNISLDLQHTVLDPGFMNPTDIMHESVITGVRTWSKKHDYVNFSFIEHLYLYEGDEAKSVFDQLKSMENKIVTFFFHIDGGMTQQMVLVLVDTKPVLKPYDNDLAICYLVNTDYLQVSKRIKVRPGGKKLVNDEEKYIRTKGIVL